MKIEAAKTAPSRRLTPERLATLLAVATIVVGLGIVLAPWLAEPSALGFHDWDAQAAQRELVRRSIATYHELPFWNPYACGGFPAWGYVEGATTLVSPWLPAYLALPLATAVRVELFGMAALGAFGAYLLAGRFTRVPAARALVAVLWAFDGRFGLQIAVGHTWHLAYAFTPLCLYFLDRSLARDARTRELAAASACFAMLVYAGGVYPLPHTGLLLGLYGAALAVAERSVRPLVRVATVIALGTALAAPKLLPILDEMGHTPRLIESNEVFPLGALLTALTSRDQAYRSRPAQVRPYGWHEWGIYVGWAGLALLVVGVLFARGKRERALTAAGAAFVSLGLGAFHPFAPWSLLHQVPPFRSLHVPSRFLYVAALALAVVAASTLGRLVERLGRKARWVSVAASLVVLGVGLDVASVAALPMREVVTLTPPWGLPRGKFHIEKKAPFSYANHHWAAPMYLAMLGDTGVLECYGFPPFEGRGALDQDDARFRGDVELHGPGSTTLGAFSPSGAKITVASDEPDALVVYNMNFDPGWRASVVGGGAIAVFSHEGRVAFRVPAGTTRVALRYVPRRLAAGLVFAALAVAALGASARAARRRRAGRGVDERAGDVVASRSS